MKISQELWLTFRNDDNEVIAVEQENGEITRYITEKSSSGKSLKAFGADVPPQRIKEIDKPHVGI